MGLRSSFAAVAPTPAEVRAVLPGDDVVPRADVVMDRAFTLEASVPEVWPWIVQLGKQRAGWYLPRSVERIVPPSRRASRTVDPRWQQLAVGDVVPDWGGKDATFRVVSLEAPGVLVYDSVRGNTRLSWAIVLSERAMQDTAATRVHLRLRLAPVKHPRVADALGGFFDLATIAGMAAGLAERLADQQGDGPRR